MRLYFDTCCLNRPLDDRSQLRIALEAEAVLGILSRCEAGTMTLVSSEILVLEANRNPHPQKKAYVISILERSQIVIKISAQIEERAMILETLGFKAFDALHIASAESGAVDYFCTCDDQILKKAGQQIKLSVNVTSPLDFALEMLL